MSRLTAVTALLAAMATAIMGPIAGANAASTTDKLVLQLHGPAQFEFAGYYAALWKGFYRDAGLTVEIVPGGGRGQTPTDAVREVTEGRAQFATGNADLVVRTAQGLPLLLLAPIFQESSATVYYRADADFPSPGALVKARLGRLPVSNILDIELSTALQAEGVDAGKLRTVALEPGQTASALAARQVDAAMGSAWELPWQAREKNLTLKSFNPADYRVEYYGDTLFTLRRFADAEPQKVYSFRAATLKGWEYALQHPDEIAAQMVAELPRPPGIADPTGFARFQEDVAQRLARYPEVTLGHSNPERWDRIETSMIGVGALLKTADVDDFVYDPDAEARAHTDLRAMAILGTTLIGCLAVTAWLLFRWRRRPVLDAAPQTAMALAPAAAAPVRARTEPTAPAPVAAASPVAVAPPVAVPAPSQPTGADLNAVLSGLERTIRQRLPRRAGYRLSLLPELWRCRAETPVLRGLVLNLVAGAVADLTANAGRASELVVGTRNITFDAAAVDDTPGAQLGEYVRVTVRDNGPGLSDDALARVLDAATTPRPTAAAAAAAMRGIGGFVRVESAEEIGTAVHLYFPRITEAAGKGDKPFQPANAAA
ncbi:MAG TPA: ABC transporter substrate-binding protein [Stellaceae bacterium]|nr:ABC transporter substrate-binding protein [Stellaceae bacterium]